MSSSSSQSSRSPSSQTLSSWSSRTQNSSKSLSSSSSSWSSESSAWDTGSRQAKSYMVAWEIIVRDNLFYARCQIDLRWRDAVIVQARGPLVADIGGVFDGEYHTKHPVKMYCPVPRKGVAFIPVPSSSSKSSQSLPTSRALRYPVSFIDDLMITEAWHSLEAAQGWVNALESRLQASMAVLRTLYAQYPNKFDQRTRTV